MYDAHLRVTKELADATREPAHEFRLPLLERVEIDVCTLDAQPCDGLRLQRLVGIRELDEGLAGNAADPDADAAEAGDAVAVDQHDLAA